MAQEKNIIKIEFAKVSVDDPFFDSLRESYAEFDGWFTKKAQSGEQAYVLFGEGNAVKAFLYVKEEVGAVNDITPPLNTDRCLKVGTFKIEAHGTKLGERFVKKIFDEALVRNIKHIYVTVFEEHEPLINILKRYGFDEYGVKETENGIEKVFVKDFNKIHGDTLLDYPVVNVMGKRIWLLAVYPVWHTRLFPDSILNTEDSSIVDDLSHTNSIHKVYIGYMEGMSQPQAGDALIIYRTAEEGKKAEYSAVATSLCVLEETRARSSFQTVEEFVDYSIRYSVFDEGELIGLFNRNVKNEMYVYKMTYNIAFPKRPIRKELIEDAGMDRGKYWGFFEVEEEAFKKVLELGGVYEGTVIY